MRESTRNNRISARAQAPACIQDAQAQVNVWTLQPREWNYQVQNCCVKHLSCGWPEKSLSIKQQKVGENVFKTLYFCVCISEFKLIIIIALIAIIVF